MRLFSVLLLVFVWCSGTMLRSQNVYTLSGRIMESNMPLDYAQVYIQDNSDKILSYIFTDSLGNYRLTFETQDDSIRLSVSRLGYLPKVMRLSVDTRYHEVELTSSQMLEEIVISETLPIRSEGDTLSYKASPFLDGTEKNVEELLKKLPGITVDENSGTIKYQGKEIKKILLDGDDLTGQNYKVLSKNLSAEWLEEVEVIKHFTSSRLLHGIQQSSEVALNLRLKEEVKAPLFGNVKVGAGTRSKYLGEAELLSYQRKVKIFLTGDVNNTGSELQNYELETYNNNQLEYKGFILPEPVLENQLNAPHFFRSEQFTFHEGFFLSNSMVATPSAHTTLNSFTSVYKNDIRFDFSDSLFYTLPGQAEFTFIQNQRQKQRPFEFFQDLKFTHNLSLREDIIARAQLKYSDDQVFTENHTNFTSIGSPTRAQSTEWYGALSYVNKLGNKWVFQSDLELGGEQLKEGIDLNRIGSMEDSVQQKTQQKLFNVGFFGRLDGVFKKNCFVNLLGGWSKSWSDWAFDLNQNSIFSSSLNDYYFQNIFGEISLLKKFRSVHFFIASRLRSAEILHNTKSHHRVLFEPTVSMSYSKTFYQYLQLSLKAMYNREFSFFKPGELIESSLLTAYRTMISYGTNAGLPVQNDAVALSVKFSENKVSYLSGHIEYLYLKADEILSTHLNIDENRFEFMEIQGGSSERFFSNYSLDRYFSAIRSTVKLAYEYSSIRTPFTIEGQSALNELEQSQFSIALGSSITDKMTLSLSYKFSKSVNSWQGSDQSFSFDNYFSKLTYRFSNYFHVAFEYRSVDFNSRSKGYNFLFNARASFESANKKLKFELIGNNIFNERSVVISNLEPSLFSVSNYPFQPGFFTFSVRYRF